MKNWVIDPPLIEELSKEVLRLVEEGGTLGVNLSNLDQRQRDIVELLSGVVIEGSYLRKEGEDDLASHSFLQELDKNLFKPPDPISVDKPELRELVRRGLVVEEGGIFFSSNAVVAATDILISMLKKKPEGITVGEIREELQTTRKYVLPLLNYLDNLGITVRRGDIRLAGKRMPDLD